MRHTPLRVHKVFLRFPNLDLAKNLSPNQLAELRGAALKFKSIRMRRLRKIAGGANSQIYKFAMLF